MKKILTIIIAFTSCMAVLSAQEVIHDSIPAGAAGRVGYVVQERTVRVNENDGSVDFVKFLPFLDDWKANVRSYRYAPFAGTKSEEMLYASANRLRTSFNKSIGLETSQFTYRVGYDYMFEIMNTGSGHKIYYAWIGFGFRF